MINIVTGKRANLTLPEIVTAVIVSVRYDTLYKVYFLCRVVPNGDTVGIIKDWNLAFPLIRSCPKQSHPTYHNCSYISADQGMSSDRRKNSVIITDAWQGIAEGAARAM